MPPDRRAPRPLQQQQQQHQHIGDEVDDLINSVTGQGGYVKREGSDGRAAPAYAFGEPGHAAAYPASMPSNGDHLGAVKAEAIPSNQPNEPTIKVESAIKTEPTIRPEPETETAAEAKPLTSPQPPTSDPTAVTTAHPASGPANADAAALTTPTAKPAKKPKKEKKPVIPMKLVYSDEVVSPEEKMAGLAKYGFDRYASEKTEFVLGEVSGAVTGEMGEEVVRDGQDRGPGS
ncbi:enolase-phosphatase E1 [Teratosphaeriaceae sp. CCFEE 6253]|nr:enolase-phosphatase E1 [Teratosphaeriaceae sp. CCFEE 6253]